MKKQQWNKFLFVGAIFWFLSLIYIFIEKIEIINFPLNFIFVVIIFLFIGGVLMLMGIIGARFFSINSKKNNERFVVKMKKIYYFNFLFLVLGGIFFSFLFWVGKISNKDYTNVMIVIVSLMIFSIIYFIINKRNKRGKNGKQVL